MYLSLLNQFYFLFFLNNDFSFYYSSDFYISLFELWVIGVDFYLIYGILEIVMRFANLKKKSNVQVDEFNSLRLYSTNFVYLALISIILQLVFSLVNYELYCTFVLGFDFDLFYRIDYFTQITKLLICLLFIFTMYFADSIELFKNSFITELPLYIYITLVFSFVIISSNHFILFFIALEGISLMSYIISTVGRFRLSIIAGSKYFVYGSLGSIYLLWSIGIFYFIVPDLSFLTILNILEHSSVYKGLFSGLDWALACFTIGLLIKLGAAPLHQWVIDLYSSVPMIIMFFYSVFIKSIIFMIFIKFSVSFTSESIVSIFSIFSLIIGTYGAISETEVKRFLAYSSITHLGFLLAADIESSLFYLFIYVITSLLLFSILLSTQFYNKEMIYLSDLKYLVNSNFNRLCVIVTISSFAGLPPFAGFFAKLNVLRSLYYSITFYNNQFSILILFVVIVTTLLVMFYYINLIFFLFPYDGNIKNSIILNKNLFFIQNKFISSNFSIIFDSSYNLKSLQVVLLLHLSIFAVFFDMYSKFINLLVFSII